MENFGMENIGKSGQFTKFPCMLYDNPSSDPLNFSVCSIRVFKDSVLCSKY